MRTLPPTMQAKIDAGVTTFCICWKLTLPNASEQTYTSNVDPLTFGGDTYLPGAGIASSVLRMEAGKGIDNGNIFGIIRDDGIRFEDLRNGIYDKAKIELTLVDYEDTDDRFTMLKGYIGQMVYSSGDFETEIRSLLQLTSQNVGYVCSPQCKADLGDDACGFALVAEEGTVTSVVGDRGFIDTGLIGAGEDWYKFGKVTWTSGDNIGATFVVKSFDEDTGEFGFQKVPAAPIQNGDTFDVVAGCDKRRETCRDKFENILRFRGEPDVPGIDAVLRVIQVD